MRKKTLGLMIGAIVATSVFAGYNVKGGNMSPAKAAILETRADNMKDGDMMKDKPDDMMKDDMKKDKSDDMMKDDMKKDKSGDMMKDDMKKDKSDGMMKDDMKKDKSDDMMKDDMKKDKSGDMMKDDMKSDKSGDMMDGKMKKDKSNDKMKMKKKKAKKMKMKMKKKKSDGKMKKKSDNMMKDDMKEMNGKKMNEMKKSDKMMDKKMYDFTLKDIDGNEFKLSDHKGKKVYLKFWASWCSICLTGLEDLNKLAGENNDFEIVTVVSPGRNREQDAESFKKWFKGLGYKNLKVLFDETGDVIAHYGIKLYPTSVYVGSNGTDTEIKEGHNSNDDIKNTIKELK